MHWLIIIDMIVTISIMLSVPFIMSISVLLLLLLLIAKRELVVTFWRKALGLCAQI